MSHDDDALVAAARAGSSAAFGHLVDRHQEAVRNFLRRLCAQSEADDLAQDTFLAAFEQLDRFRGGSSLRAWLCAIAWRKAKGRQRGLYRLFARDRAYGELRAGEAAHPISSDDGLAVRQALLTLPLEQRATVALCLAQDFSHAEAAEILRLPLGTVKSHVTRGRARLLDVLGGRR